LGLYSLPPYLDANQASCHGDLNGSFQEMLRSNESGGDLYHLEQCGQIVGLSGAFLMKTRLGSDVKSIKGRSSCYEACPAFSGYARNVHMDTPGR
jgi:hypothetical protein